MVADQMVDPECIDLKGQVIRGAGEDSAPGTYRKHADGALEQMCLLNLLLWSIWRVQKIKNQKY